MLPQNKPDRIRILFDDHRLVANAGLILPATLALRLGLPQLLRKHLDLGGAPGRANTGDKMMTLVASALAGGDCIDDADVLRAGGTARVLGFTAKAPSTLGTFLRSFRWGHVRQLDRVSRELLARVWKAGAGPGDAPFTIDLDSTICETYGLAKEGARHHGYTGARGYHPLLAVAAGTGDVLMARLREGRANTARGAAHFLRETVGRVRYCGARGQLTVVNGGEIMYRQGGSRAEMWRLKSVPPVAFNQERPNLTEGGLDVQGGYLPPCSQGLFRRRDERPRGGPSVRATPGHGAQDARVLRAPRVSTATTGSQTEARSI